MFLTLFSSFVSAATGIDASSVWPKDDGAAKAYTKTSDKINVIFPNNEAVKAGTGYVRLSDDNGLVRVISAADSRISYAKGDTVVIDFTADQKESTKYSVVVDDDAFKTVSSGVIAKVPSWSYTVGDYTAPVLKSVSPVKGSTVNKSISLVVTFTDASNIALGSGNVIIYKADGNVWDLIPVKNNANVKVDATAKTLTVSNVRALEDLTSYVVTLDAGVVTDDGKRADGKKNSYAGLSDRTVWTFTSKDFTVPAFATGYPKISDITDKSANLVVKTTESGSLYFAYFPSEQIDKDVLLSNLTGTPAVSVTAGTEVTKAISSSNNLTKSKDYFVYLVTKNSDVAPTKDDIVGPIKFKTIEKDAPTLAEIYYYKGTTLVTKGLSNPEIDQATTKIVFDFDETVSVGAGSIVIYKKSDNSVYTQIDASAITIDETDSSKAIATLSKSFENDAAYYAFIPGTLFADKYNNFYGGLTKTTDWTFSSNDIIAPTVVSYAPAQGTSKVDVKSKIVVVFSEVINLPDSGTESSTLFNLNVSGVDKDYTYIHSKNNNAYSTVTISPKAYFSSLDVVTLTVSGDVADYPAGNKLGLSQGVSFVVKDTEGPKIDSFVPDKNEKLLTSDNIVIKLDEPIYLLGGTPITSSNLYTIITLKAGGSDGVNVAATYSISDDKKVITITPKTPWVSPSGKYYVAISSDIQDATGNKCLNDLTTRSRTYYVKDTTPATVSIDLAGKTNVDVNSSITLSFKEGDDLDKDALKSLFYGGIWNSYSPAAMNKVIVLKKGDANGVNIPFTVTTSDDALTTSIDETGKVFVVKPDVKLDGAQTYYVGIGASTTDQSDNINIANYTTFTTKYVDAPKVVSKSPSTDQTEVATSSSIVVTFNTKVNFTGSISVVDQGGNAVATTLDSGNGTTTLTFKHTDPLKANSTYTVTIQKSSVTNAANSVVLADNLVWSFSTVDKKFALASLAPIGPYNENAIEGTVELDSPLTIKVDEKVVAGVGNIYIKNYATDLLIEQIASTSSKVSIDYTSGVSTITIIPSANFVYGTNYYIEVDEGAFVDTKGNGIPAIVGRSQAPGNWTFGAVNPELKVESVSPYNVENVATDAEMVITFNRPIVKGTSSQVGFDEYDFNEGTNVETLKQSVRYGITSSNLVVSGNTLTIKHADKLFSSKSKVYVILEDLAVKASTKTSSSTALAKSNKKYFFVGDYLAPVATISPEWNKEKNNYSPLSTPITISFNEDILNAETGVALTDDNVTFSGKIIKIDDGSSDGIDFKGKISGRVITLTPTSSLKESSTYTVTISADKIKDTSSHKMDKVSAIFKTVDLTLPVINLTFKSGIKNQLIASGISVNEVNPGYFYYILKKASEAAPTLAEVKSSGEKVDLTASLVNPTSISDIEFNNLDAATSYVLYYFSEDARGNVTTLKSSTKSTIDTVSPLLVSTFPVNGATDVDVNTKNIVLTFNEDVNINPIAGGKIYFKDKATNSLIATLDQSALVANASSKKSIDIVLKSNFPASLPATTVYVEVDGGLILDVYGNAFDGFTGASQLYFTTEDNLVPSVKEYTFTGDDVSHVVLNSNFGIVFSEDVAAGSANAILYEGTVTSTTTAVEVFKGSEVTISGNIVTLNPSSDLKNGQDYILEIQNGFVKDLAGNSFTPTTDWKFKTDVNVAPYVSKIDPVEFKGQNKSDLTNITITFNKNVYLPIAGIKKSLALLTSGDVANKISLKTAAGIAVPFVVSYTAGDVIKLGVNPDDLDHLTSYVLTISGFVDVDGSEIESTSFNYTTGDGQYPVATFSPADNDENVDASSILTLTFDENIYRDAKLYNGKLFYSIFDNTNVDKVVTFVDKSGNPVAFDAKFNGTNKITITPTKALISGARYTYGFKDDEISDINGNKSPLKTVTFTVKDTDKPTYKLDLVNVSPVPNATSVSADAKVWIKFSDPIVVGSGVINIRYEDGTLFETVSGSKLSISKDDAKTLVIAHKDFDSNKEYFVEIGEGVVTDKSGNTNVAMLDPTPDNGWVFTTKDTFDLTASTSPVGENTSRTVSLALTFNKVPEKASGYLSVYKSNGTAVYNLPVSGAVISGVTATFSTIALDADQSYYARIDKGAFVAKNNNDVVYAGIADNSWTFSTVNNIKPVVKTLTPADNSTAVSQYSEFSILFDRAIALGTGSIQLRKVVDGTILQSINVADAKISDKTLTFKFANTLPANTELYIIVPAGAVINTEVTADAFDGILDTYSWNFTTSTDNTAPTVTVTDPVAPIAKVFNVGLLFSEPVTGVASGITVTNGTFVVSGSGAQYSVTVTSDEQKVVTIVLANTITDLASPANAFAGKTLSYTTADLTAPKVVATTPTGTLTDNHPTLVVTFDENVVFGAGKLNIYKKSDNTLALAVPVTASMVSGKVATVTYTYDATLKNGLDRNTDYYVLADAGLVKDVAGNAFAGITATTTWTFKTGDFATITDPDVNNSLEFKVYPNPFVESVTVSNASELSKVVVSNIAGQVVKEVVYPDGTIQLNELHSGVYFVALYKDGKVVSTVKLLKR
jgi:hypothetical protein